ncbi:MAG: hypothetical protein R3F14_17930 [Polyangiaceae bacterium]
MPHPLKSPMLVLTMVPGTAQATAYWEDGGALEVEKRFRPRSPG